MLAIRMIYVKKYCNKKGQLSLVMLENQIREDKEGRNDLKVCFVLFVLGALLCLTMKLFVKRSFLHRFNKENELGWICVVLSCVWDQRV